MVFRNLLFVSNTLYGFKIDEMREFFLTKITLQTFNMYFKNSRAIQGKAFRHLWQMKNLEKFVYFSGVFNLSL